MKTIQLTLVCIFMLIIVVSCDKNESNPTLEAFCNIRPSGWDCEIIEDNFSLNDIPKNAANPIAIIKFKNLNREFTKYPDLKINPSLTLDLYPISLKEELIDFIYSQQIYSWCIPMYYGETKDYFIITSPCFINNGSFTEEADSCIMDLHKALNSIIIINDYNNIGN